MADMVLGLDGGNSKTIALVARADGTVVGVGRAGPSDIYGASSGTAALNEAARAAHEALLSAGAQTPDLKRGAYSMAGADWPEDMVYIERGMRRRGFDFPTLVVNDAMGGLRAGSVDGVGVAVVCGTGAAIGARGHQGQRWHSSWWQEPQGAIHLAEQALQAVYRAELGIGQSTSLTEKALRLFSVSTVEEVLHLFTARRGARPRDLGQVTRILLEEATNGDAVALQIVRDHGTSLGQYAVVAAHKVGLHGRPYTLVLSGGVFRHPSTVLRDALVDRVSISSPALRVEPSRLEPAAGSVLLALEASGEAVTLDVLSRLTSSLPGPDFFAT